MISPEELKIKINIAVEDKKPFLFAIDYELSEGLFIEDPLTEVDILWRVGAHTNYKTNNHINKQANHQISNDINDKTSNRDKTVKKGSFFNIKHVDFDIYSAKFNYVKDQLQKGNSFLANLTIKTEIETDYTLEDIFKQSNSKYALYIKDKLVCFSPETFVKIYKGVITSNPMKGTIDGSIENAAQIILGDYKESGEHYTIVDFIRSDLSRVSSDIKVEKFRYIDTIPTSNGEILQVSSLISGRLMSDKVGDILFKLLPAGSISGAPKKSTVGILQQAEGQPRGYYTGVFGYFDGMRMDSAVMIRYIEKEGDRLFFRSGGGITINSVCEQEYKEALDKIYLPFK